uniref:Putative head tail connector protein n=1 Tax=viral metagenome TaxID=1070528 RepID=A0A6M3L375_9ZZZZ
MSETTAKDKIKRFKELLGQRDNFSSYWQNLHEYFYIESPDITRAYAQGAEMDTNRLYDSTTLEAPDVLASGFMNYLTPPTAKWFRLRSKDQRLLDNKEVTDFLDDVADEVYHTLNKSNFYEQSFPNYKSSGVYGTSILLEEDDLEDVARFYSLPLTQCCIAEDARGRVVQYYIEFEYTSFQAATRWGMEALTEVQKQEVNGQDQNKKHKYLLCIGKREIRDVTKIDKKNLPIEATWIDVENEKVVEEGGYYEFPVFTHRFDKRPFIAWGFSPAMKALPFARLLNAIAKTNLRAMMKATDPPVAVPHNAFIMPFNANPRAMNYYKKTSMDGAKDIFSFANFGDPKTGMAAVEYYTQQIKSLMYNDIFLTFENITKQMQNPEVQERINEKMAMLGPAVGRYMGAVLNPTIIRTIGILDRAGRLPDVPDALRDNPQFEIDYVSQLAQAQKRSELNSLMTGLQLVGQVAQFVPESLDKIDTDTAIDEAWDIIGAPVKVLRDDQEVQTIRENRQQAMAQEQQLLMAQGAAKAGRDIAAGEKDLAQATDSSRRR